MTNKQLSPEAQAVRDAAFSAYWSAEQEAPNDEGMIAAAALRELVFQLQYYNCLEGEDMILDARAILELADELEAL